MADNDPAKTVVEEMQERLTRSSNALCTILPEWADNPDGGNEALDAIEEIAKRGLAVVLVALERHQRPQKPTPTWDLDLRCPNHRDFLPPSARFWDAVRDCPGCSYRDVWYCTGCKHEQQWPCPEYEAILSALTGKAESGGRDASADD